MNYWRMQLHPSQPEKSVFHASQSLAAGFIGLDFAEDIGDLGRASPDDLPQSQKDYRLFADSMKVGDRVLIIAHHFPFAICTVEGEYNYIKRPEPELGVWFRHFRRVEDVRYWADCRTNAQKWDQTTMTDTISSLIDPGSKSMEVIRKMGG